MARSAAPRDLAQPPSETNARLPPIDWVEQSLSTALQAACCDEVELVWIASRAESLGLRVAQESNRPRRHASLQVRVREGDRQGTYRIDCCRPAAVEAALRSALAQARRGGVGGRARLPCKEQPTPGDMRLHDPRIADLRGSVAEQLLSEWLHDDESAVLDWHEAQVVIANSNGLERSTGVTAATLQVRSGPPGSGAGFASDAFRHLDEEAWRAVIGRSRQRRSTDPHREAPTAGTTLSCPVVLAPEAAAQLVDLLNHRAFAADAYCGGESFLRQHTGVQVFDSRVSLRDDGTDGHGLALPFDLEGRTKFPVVLIDRGVPRTPTVDTLTASELGVQPTASCVGCCHAFGMHLFLEPGDQDTAELLQLADGGVWISRIEGLECFHPERMLVRARARGVRRIEGGALAHPLPDLVWQDSLLRVFSDIRGIGHQVARRPTADGFLGGIAAPEVVVGSVDQLRVA